MLLWVEHGAAEKKGRKRKRRCRRWILSGGLAPPDSIVNVGPTVLRNDQIAFREDDGASGSVDPIYFAARKGARLNIIAFDAQAGRHALGPLYLHGKRNGKAPELSAGVPETCPNVAVGEFFAETLTL